MPAFSISIDEELYLFLSKLKKNNEGIQDVVRRILKEYKKKHEK